MDVDIAYSINGVPIRLTEERWEHVVRNKPYMRPYCDDVLKAIEKPTCVLRGYAGAVVGILSLGRWNYLSATKIEQKLVILDVASRSGQPQGLSLHQVTMKL